ncbi:MAG: amidohydrolase family protein [Saprospiraceae bacterium]|nr:amidohydrolase family protein [Saprospiraceae bacterium]
MEILFQNVCIIDPRSVHHLKMRDVLISNGKIIKIGSKLNPTSTVKVLFAKNSYLSPGWVDIACYGGEPGYEERETLDCLSNAAIHGGYTRIAYMPNTFPAIHSKSEVHFLMNRQKELAIHIHPIGAISKSNEAIEMAEILQMQKAGAVAFSDGNSGIRSSGLLRRALEYIQLIPSAILIQHSYDSDLSPNAQVHESVETNSLGLKTSPSLAEFSAVQRDISILEYTQSRMLLNKISCSESVQMVRKYKKSVPNLFATVSVFNLVYQDSDLTEFPSSLKLIPPIRSKSDLTALWKGLKDQTIDIIVSDHFPLNPELKDLEFQNAGFGAISLETAFSLFNSQNSDADSLTLWVSKCSLNPRKIFSLPEAGIVEGSDAELTWFDPTIKWKYNLEKIKSLAKNSPCINQELTGKVLGVFSKNKFHLTH